MAVGDFAAGAFVVVLVAAEGGGAFCLAAVVVVVVVDVSPKIEAVSAVTGPRKYV